MTDDESLDIGYCPRCGNEVEAPGALLCWACGDEDTE